MTSRDKKTAEPQKTKGTPKDQTVELQVEELEERIAPMKARV
jgi:hypothetical protein